MLFLTVGPILTLCSFPEGSPAGDRLLRSYLGGHQTDTPGFGTTEFQLSYGQWVRVLHAAGYTLERLEELQAREGVSPP